MEQKIFTCIIGLLVGVSVWAHDFEVFGIYYNIVKDTYQKNVVVTKDQNSNFINFNYCYEGDIDIPSEVSYNGILYKVISIGDSAFYNCWKLSSVSIPNSVTSIGDYTFYGCSGLTSVSIPNSVTSIGSSAFRECSGLSSISIPNNVTSIGYAAFLNCNNLREVIIEDGSSPLSFKISCSDDAFCSNKSLKKLYLGRNLVNNNIFGKNSNLSYITIGDSVTMIKDHLFENCSNLKSVVIPNSITSIGNLAFKYVNKVFFLGNKQPYNVYEAFPNCKVYYTPNEKFNNMKGIHKPYSLLNSMFEIDGVIYIPTSQKTCDLVDVNYSLDSINSIIGPSVKYTNANGRQYEFKVCNINMYAGYECNSFSSLKLNNIGNIEVFAFSKSNVSSIEITCSDTSSIEENAFSECLNAKEIKVSNIKEIGKNAFKGCSAATSITISNNGDIKDYAFSDCSAVTSINVSNGVKNIGKYAFSGNVALTSFSLGSSVETIGEYAFSKCNALIDFTSYSTIPPLVSSNAFLDINKLECTLHVPLGASNAYMEANYWNEFWIEEDVITNITNINTNHNSSKNIYNIMGRKLAKPQKGVNIIDGKKIIIK